MFHPNRNLIPLLLLFTLPAAAQVDPLGRSVLFIRGSSGSGGLGQGTASQRTEHLSGIENRSTQPGNHGFGALADRLRQEGFQVSQWVESQGSLTAARLAPHRVVVFGSNNRTYSAAEIKVFHDWFDAGGSALFISDANWGPNFNAAPASDNLFLARYGMSVYQDSASGVPVMRRSDPGRFALPGHPLLSGPDGSGGQNDVQAYEGEGVSYFNAAGNAGYQPRVVVSATGFQVRQLDPLGIGPLTAAGPSDGALVVLTRGNSVIVGHFDRNSFFNPGGTGSDLTRRDNRQLALNIFRFLASVPGAINPVGSGCGAGPPVLGVDAVALGRDQTWSVTAAAPGAPGLLWLGAGPSSPLGIAPGCTFHPSLSPGFGLLLPAADAQGRTFLKLTLPGGLELSGQTVTGQALLARPGGPLLGAAELSNGVEVVLGFSR